MDATKITCRRCRGKGIVAAVTVCNGIPGGCFACLGSGKVYKDKFSAAFIEAQGDWYGFTTTYRHGLFVTKNIARCSEEEAKFACVGMRTTCAKITEEQARKFFEKYGVSTYVYPKAK